MARKYNNRKNNNNSINNSCYSSRYGYIPSSKSDEPIEIDPKKIGKIEHKPDQRVDVNADLGFGFDVDIAGSLWGRGQIDSKTVTGAPVTGAGSGRGHINFKLHLDGEAESEGEVKGMLARAFLKILS